MNIDYDELSRLFEELGRIVRKIADIIVVAMQEILADARLSYYLLRYPTRCHRIAAYWHWRQGMTPRGSMIPRYHRRR